MNHCSPAVVQHEDKEAESGAKWGDRAAAASRQTAAEAGGAVDERP